MGSSLRKQILSLVLIPTVIIGIVLTSFAVTILHSSLKNAAEDELQTASKSTLDALRFKPGAYVMGSDGVLKKGDAIISEDTSILDNLLTNSGIYSTFYFGNKAIMSSIKGTDGNMFLEDVPSDAIVDKVINKGIPYFNENEIINGEEYYGYYIPIDQSVNMGEGIPEPNGGPDGQKPETVGMFFTAVSKAEITKLVMHEVFKIIIACVVMFIMAIVAAITLSNKIINALKRTVNVLNYVSEGDLIVEISDKDYARRDEIGDLTRATVTLRDNLKEMIKNIVSTAGNLNEAANVLDESSILTSKTSDEVARAVEDISAGATSQAMETQQATDNVIEIGKMIQTTTNDVKRLSDNAEQMKVISKSAMDILEELNNTNSNTQVAIEEIAKQTSTTNDSAQKIKEATAFIASIADETNLLALNASIEAARAGEHGRGFAVVAAQIQKLAEQSNESTALIEKVITELLEDTNNAVNTMEEVKNIIGEQSNNVVKTKEMFGTVNKGINDSIDGVAVIADRMSDLNKKRESVVDIVQSLTAIAQENAASTEETSASVEELNATMSEISNSAKNLNVLAESLKSDMKVFKV